MLTSNSIAAATGDDSKAISSSVRYPSLLICTLIDGSVIALSSDSGQLSSFFQTGRDLVSTTTTTNNNNDNTDDKNNLDNNKNNNHGNMNHHHHTLVVPDLDGNLYQTRNMQELGVTIDEILQAPVQTCVENHFPGQPPLCGIVTAAKLTSLYGMDASSGKLVWSSHSSSPPSDSSSNSKSSSNDIVVLQREDYFVQHLSASTGNQVWNVTLGRFSAPNFGSKRHSASTGPTTTSTTGNLMIDDDGIEDLTPENEDDDIGMMMVKMPFISFDEQGRILTVIDQNTRQVQWRRQLPHVIARVYGLCDGIWVPLTIVEPEDDENPEDHDDDTGTPLSEPQQLLLPPGSQDDEIYQLLMEQQLKQAYTAQQWAFDTSLGLYHPPLVNELNNFNDNSDEARTQEQLQQQQLQQQQLGNGVVGPMCVLDSLRPDVFICVQPGEPAFYVPIPDGVQQTPIATVPVYPPDLRPSGGLFLTWPILAGIVITAIAGACGIVYMYLNKKQNWLVQPEDSTPATSHHSDIPPNFHHYHWTGMCRCTIKSSIPYAQGTSKPGRLSLVRYSRYRSEFKELAPLGKGGFGSVFECQNLLDGRKYAVKKVPIQLFDDPQLTRDRLQRVLREVKILALLDHPNIVRYYTAWMEVEERTDEGRENMSSAARGTGDEGYYTSYKYRSKRYSSSILLTTAGWLDDGRPSQMTMNRRRGPPQQSGNRNHHNPIL
ncbi:protein tyrosine kinase [Fragilaria crotonensis]|nr:protein tyrosine kinase [Fragilaria crotonensis]